MVREMPGLVAVLPVSALVEATVRRAVQAWPVQPIIVTDLHDKHDAYAAAGAALTKSGTSTLELALAGVPMAVTYRVNPVSAAMARRMLRIPHVAMVNLLAQRALVPELLQADCNPATLAADGAEPVAGQDHRAHAAGGVRGRGREPAGASRVAVRGSGAGGARAVGRDIGHRGGGSRRGHPSGPGPYRPLS